ncbi:hypothetical protein Gotur_021040 [Gossypium turneri]
MVDYKELSMKGYLTFVLCGGFLVIARCCVPEQIDHDGDGAVQGGSEVEKSRLQAKKEGVAVDRDFGVRKRDVRVKGKGISVSLGPKASGRVLKPNNSGAGFSSKKAVSGFVAGDLLGCVSMDGSLDQENFKVVSLKPNLDKSKHMVFRTVEVG